jgi:hypothetical protein
MARLTLIYWVFFLLYFIFLLGVMMIMTRIGVREQGVINSNCVSRGHAGSGGSEISNSIKSSIKLIRGLGLFRAVGCDTSEPQGYRPLPRSRQSMYLQFGE